MTSSKKIQLIEDDHEISAVISPGLVDRGYEIIVSHTGREGFFSIFENFRDPVLCDVNMRVMSGLEFHSRSPVAVLRFIFRIWISASRLQSISCRYSACRSWMASS